MAITGATTTSTTNIGALSDGVRAGMLQRLRLWKRSPFLMSLPKVIEEGTTNTRSISMDEYGPGSVAAFSENTTINATEAPALLPVSSTVATYAISVAWTSELMAQTKDRDKLTGMLHAMSIEALLDHISHGATVGMAQLAASMTIIATDAGATAQVSTVDSARLALEETFGSGKKTVLITSPKGMNDYRNDITTTGNTAYSSESMKEFIADIVLANKSLGEFEAKFVYNNVAYFQTNRADQVYQVGGNDHSVIMIPDGDPMAPPEDGTQILGGIQLAGRPNPCMARKDAVQVASHGAIGIYAYDPPVEENATQTIYVIAWDAWLPHTTAATNPARAMSFLT